MKTLYITRGNNIVVDNETKDCDRLHSARQAIDYIYFAKEPMHIVYGYEGEKYEIDCDANDIVICFYEDSFKHKLVVVKNDQWVENLLAYEKKEQEDKLRWAEAKNCNECESISK